MLMIFGYVVCLFFYEHLIISNRHEHTYRHIYTHIAIHVYIFVAEFFVVVFFFGIWRFCIDEFLWFFLLLCFEKRQKERQDNEHKILYLIFLNEISFCFV